ncbi:MAG: trypsin-like serine protease [Clostridiales bacterium]|nr:trypsin-like serine protease [Clostridiales bacterium]
MINKKYMMTSAHVVYSEKYGAAQSVTAYFGVNGSSYKKKASISSYSYCTSYPSTPSTANDWAYMKLSSNIGSTIGWFSIGYTTKAKLKVMTFTICGYPADKMVKDTKSDVLGYRVYMYKDNSSPYKVTKYEIRYSADTEKGQSGSPVYNDSNVVYGIHHGGRNKNCNTSRRITKSLFNSLKKKGVIN